MEHLAAVVGEPRYFTAPAAVVQLSYRYGNFETFSWSSPALFGEISRSYKSVVSIFTLL
jgi:hypothetical protein